MCPKILEFFLDQSSVNDDDDDHMVSKTRPVFWNVSEKWTME